MPTHLDLLRCPVTHAPLRPATGTEDTAARARGEQIARRIAAPAKQPLDVEFVVDGAGARAYPVVNGIYCLSPNCSIALGPGEDAFTLDATKEGLRQFYDEVGWAQDPDETEYHDAVLFEDLRPVSADYRHAANERVVAALPESGAYLLDVASGPIQYEDYLHFSDHFAYRICVDLSFRALLGAQARLGTRGVFVVGDVTNLPLRDGAVDATISLHTIYHVPSDQQADAFEEVARVTRPGSVAVVVYSWAGAPVVRALTAPTALVRRGRSVLRRLRRRTQRGPRIDLTREGFYFEPHTRAWFENRSWSFEYEVRVWRAVPVVFLTAYARGGLGGTQLLRAISRAEDRWPKLCGEHGQYPLIVLRPASVRQATDASDAAATRR